MRACIGRQLGFTNEKPSLLKEHFLIIIPRQINFNQAIKTAIVEHHPIAIFKTGQNYHFGTR